MIAVAGPSGRRERQEQAQPEKAPRPLHRRHIGVDTGNIGRHEADRDLKRARQHARVPGNEHAAAHRRRKPLVCVDRDGVRQLDPGEDAAQPLGRDQRSAPGRIHVVPEFGAAGDLRTGRQRIDHARVGGPGSGRDHDRHAALRAVGSQRVAQGIRVHASGSIGGHKTHRGASDTRLVRDLEPGKMALL